MRNPRAPSHLNSRLLGYVTIGYIEPSSHYLGNWSPRETLRVMRHQAGTEDDVVVVVDVGVDVVVVIVVVVVVVAVIIISRSSSSSISSRRRRSICCSSRLAANVVWTLVCAAMEKNVKELLSEEEPLVLSKLLELL